MASTMSPVDLMPSGIEYENGIVVAITTIFTFLAIVAVILRFISRRISMSLKWDDWFSLIALIFAFGCFIVTLLDATIAHGGYDIEYYSAATLERYLKVKIFILSPKNALSTNETLICLAHTSRKRIVRREYLLLKSSSPSPLPSHFQNSKIFSHCIVDCRLPDRRLLYRQRMLVNLCL